MGLRTRQSREQGQSLVVVALMLVALIGFLGLVIDVGNLYAQRRFMQNAADAAALAGARAQAENKSLPEVQTAIREYALRHNGAQTVISDVVMAGGNSTVAVSVTKIVPSYFMGVMGIDTNTVGASAQAGLCPLGPPHGIMPFGVHANNVKFNCMSLIWDSMEADKIDGLLEPDYPDGWVNAKDNLIAWPHRGWINLDGNSGDAFDLKQAIDADGFDGTVDLATYPGTVGGKVSALIEMKAWVDPLLALSASDPRREQLKVIVPVYNGYTQDGSNATFDICGFAVMRVDRVYKTGDEKYILGEFLNEAIVDPDARCGPNDFGARIVQLER